MSHRAACLQLAVVIVVGISGLSASAARASERLSLYWEENQCWQTGQLGAQSFSCENAAVPNYLATHTVQDPERTNVLSESSGLYCSYYGIADSVTKPESKPQGFNLLGLLEDYQVGDGYGNTCGVWANPGEPVEWGTRVTPGALSCVGALQLCGMQSYASLDSQSDRPWSEAFGEPILELHGPVYSMESHPGEKGQNAGYVCPVLQEAKTGDVIEACFEEWVGWGAHATGGAWEYEHVVECRPGTPGFSHSVDKIMEPTPETLHLFNTFGEPIEEPLSEHFSVSPAIGRAEMSALVELDDKPFVTKTAPGGRASEPELNAGCGRSLSTSPAEWILIGIANGVEAWGGAHLALQDAGSVSAYTSYHLLPIEVSLPHATATSETEAEVTMTINPHGYQTAYVVEYGTGTHYGETEPIVLGSGTTPVPVTATLTGLIPHSDYHYQVRAFHPERGEAVYSPSGEFLTPPAECAGANVAGQGDSGPNALWAVAFHTSGNRYACNGTQGAKGTPTVAFASTDAGEALESWGANGHASEFGVSNAFLSTVEPPTAGQKAEMESHERTLVPEVVETIPVAQSAIAIVVHLPVNCTATSKKDPGRLELDNVTLEGIFRGAITKWNEIADDEDALSGSGCDDEAAIAPVVRRDQAGDTHAVKRYLDLIHEASFASETGATVDWNYLSDGIESTVWPKAAHVVKPAGNGEAELLAKVAETPGSIGYANLADARADGAFTASPGSGGAGTSLFWAPVQNSGVATTGKLKYADPSTNGDTGGAAEANCKDTEYTNWELPFPPRNVGESWSEVSTATIESRYPLCTLLYDVALDDYAAVARGTVWEAETVNNYLHFVVNTKAEGGQKLIAGHDYLALPKGVVQELAEKGATKIGF